MTKPLTIYKSDTEITKCQIGIPITRQLESIFRMIPEEELLKALKGIPPRFGSKAFSNLAIVYLMG